MTSDRRATGSGVDQTTGPPQTRGVSASVPKTTIASNMDCIAAPLMRCGDERTSRTAWLRIHNHEDGG